MATTVEVAELSVNITESISLNGVDYGNNLSKTYSEVGEVDQRIMSIAPGEGTFTNIFSFSTVDGQGTGVKASYKYFRITNLDDTNFVTLQIKGTADTFWIKLKSGDSFMLMDNEMDAIASSTTFGAFTDITLVAADADTAAVDIEYVTLAT